MVDWFKMIGQYWWTVGGAAYRLYQEADNAMKALVLVVGLAGTGAFLVSPTSQNAFRDYWWIAALIGVFTICPHIWREQQREIARLRKELDLRKRNRAVRSTLGDFIQEGKSLLRALHTEKKRIPNPEIDEWIRRLKHYLCESLDKSYADTIDVGARLPHKECPFTSMDQRDAWFRIQTRLYNLSELMYQLRAEEKVLQG